MPEMIEPDLPHNTDSIPTVDRFHDWGWALLTILLAVFLIAMLILDSHRQ